MTTKKRAIVNYDKLSIEQKKGILKEFPDGYINHLTSIKTPTGEILDALIWETPETIYLVKFPKLVKAVVSDDDDDDELEEVTDLKDDDLEDEEEEEEDYDKPEEEEDED